MAMAQVTPSHLPDLTSLSGTATPTRLNGKSRDGTTSSKISMKRKQTLLSLLDALHELSQDDEVTNGYGDNDKPNFDDDRDVPTVDEHIQVAGAESFNKFQRRIHALDKELRNFANASRQLGSSVGILSSAFHLRERLAEVLFLFRENAADLFPRKVARQGRESTVVKPTANLKPGLGGTTKYIAEQTKTHRQPQFKKKWNAPPHVSRPMVPQEHNLDPESFPEQMEMLARDVTTFLNCLNEFPEFTDEAVNASILSFEGDLKYWSSCLMIYKTQFRFPAVQRYIHDLTGEMGDHLDSITSTLSMFIEIGVPTIRFAQKHGATNLLNLSTVATFFSAVTATTLQFSYAPTRTDMLSDAVNAFWFSSLVFSIAAAVNSLLGLTWKQAMYRSPGHRVPWWVLIWIKRSPLVFLVFSVACFSIGLVLFAYSSGQSRITSVITTVLTAFTSFGLAAVSLWFASERWAYNHHQGRKWLGDVLRDAKTRFYRLRAMVITKNAFDWSGQKLKRAGVRLRRVPSFTTSFFGMSEEKVEEGIENGHGHGNGSNEDNGLPFANSPEPISPGSMYGHGRHRGSDVGQSGSAFPFELRNMASSPTSDNENSESNHGDSADGNVSSSPNKGRFASAVRSVMMLQSASTMASPLGAFAPSRKRTNSSTLVGGILDASKKLAGDSDGPVRGSKNASLMPKLKKLEPTQDLAAHQALVRHLQFSPDGKFLATSSWDRTSVIFRVGDPFTSHRILAHPQGFVGQVAWSSSGNILLTKLNRGIKVWTEDGVCKKTIDRHRAVQSIAWVPGGEAFMSVEGSFVTKLDLNGKILDTYHFERMMLQDVAVTSDGLRLIGVGPLLTSPTGLHPSKSRVEKQLVVFNMMTKQCENQTPVLNDVRDITFARNGMGALVSYENKAPPQLWRLQLVKDRDDPSISTGRLSLRHTFMPKTLVDFAGPSYFGGKDDQLVICAGKAGDIHIWDRASAVLLHHIRAQEVGGDLTCIAWNPAIEDPYMFATGSHDGAVRIWSSPTNNDEAFRDKDKSGASNLYLVRGGATPDTLEGAGTCSSGASDVEYPRTDSPDHDDGTDDEGEAEDDDDDNRNAVVADEVRPSSRERTIAFAAPETRL